MNAPAAAGARQVAAASAPPPDTCTPADRYQELFIDVQQQWVYEDSKTFVDCAPRDEPAAILRAYREHRDRPGFDLRRFVQQHFQPPAPAGLPSRSEPGRSLAEHIDRLWLSLTREPKGHPVRGSLVQLPCPYVVPGGRFVELYYWDTYFTMLGLAESGRQETVWSMTDNLAHLIDTYGHVPNGTRTYYLSRSQPPVFALMTQLCEASGGAPATEYLPQLRREHAFWMAGEQGVEPGTAHRRVVALADGSVLNRYWDDRCGPREESWREDVATAARSARPHHEVWRDLRAAAESGWDFSTRWMRDPAHGLASTCTTQILPVDLNCFLHTLESGIGRLGREIGDASTAAEFEHRSARRAEAIDRHFWDAEQGMFADWDWFEGRRRTVLTAAAATPLFSGVASARQARTTAATLRSRLLAPGGLGTTEHASGQQWDRPNGWAPLQWIAVEGLARHGCHELADEIRARWMHTVQGVYERDGKLVEKYRLRSLASELPSGGGGGEYPLQDGFGWTNGITRCWIP